MKDSDFNVSILFLLNKQLQKVCLGIEPIDVETLFDVVLAAVDLFFNIAVVAVAVVVVVIDVVGWLIERRKKRRRSIGLTERKKERDGASNWK